MTLKEMAIRKGLLTALLLLRVSPPDAEAMVGEILPCLDLKKNVLALIDDMERELIARGVN